MGARGPRPDPAQAAKGFPGRRRSKATKAAEEATRIAGLLAVGPGTAELPILLQDPKYQPAAALWRRHAPELRRTNRLPVESEFHFTQWCIYAQEWVEATEDLHVKGFTQSIQTVAGGKMERRRPKNFEREVAQRNLMELSARFGLSTGDMYALFKGQVAAATARPDLFGSDRQAQDTGKSESKSMVGSMNGQRSTPPPGSAVQ